MNSVPSSKKEMVLYEFSNLIVFDIISFGWMICFPFRMIDTSADPPLECGHLLDR
jgi:hypothetical protein